MPTSEEFRPAEKISPPAGYIGGKRRLSTRLVELINSVPHRTYAEPFVGMGGVFFRRDRRLGMDFPSSHRSLGRVLHCAACRHAGRPDKRLGFSFMTAMAVSTLPPGYFADRMNRA